MADWSKIISRGSVEDRRRMSPGLGGVGLLGTIIVLALTYYTSGGDLGAVVEQLDTVQVVQELTADDLAKPDDYASFASAVLGSTDDWWKASFANDGLTYHPPKLVLFRGATSSGCGIASSDVGPHYCPYDQTIYLDETFFDELQSRFKAKGGDVAEAYVIAHEVGHHVQNELGIMESFQVALEKTPDDHALSIGFELQADCLAGVWASSVQKLGIFEPGEIEEAVDAAAAVGDDRIQATINGRIEPETWTHGSSGDRVTWFKAGFGSGNPATCSTFE